MAHVTMNLAGPTPAPAPNKVERRRWLRAAGNNPNLLPDHQVALDLRSDSWDGHAGAEQSPQAPSRKSLEIAFGGLYGYPCVTAVFRGRFAEAILATALIPPGTVVAGNALFPTACFHLESRGARLINVGVPASCDPGDPAPFKADLDLAVLAVLLDRNDGAPLACVWVEACANALGGQPVSLANLRRAHALCQAAGVPLVLDATRLLDNVLLCREREDGLSAETPSGLLHEFTRNADICVMSAMKDFPVGVGGFLATRSEELHVRLQDLVLAYGSGLDDAQRQRLANVMDDDPFSAVAERVRQVRWLHDELYALDVPLSKPVGGHAVIVDARGLLPHLAVDQHPAAALTAALYELTGMRAGDHLAPADWGPRRWLRLTVPVARYDEDALGLVVAACAAVREAPEQVHGLRQIGCPPGVSGRFAARYEPLNQ